MRSVSSKRLPSRFPKSELQGRLPWQRPWVLMAELYGRTSGGRTLYRSSEGENMQIKQSQWRGRPMEKKMFETSVHATTVATMTRLTCAMSRRDECSAFFFLFPPDSFIKYSDWCSNNSFKYFPCCPSVADEIFPFFFCAAWKWPVMYGSAEDSIIFISISSIHSCGSF